MEIETDKVSYFPFVCFIIFEENLFFHSNNQAQTESFQVSSTELMNERFGFVAER